MLYEPFFLFFFHPCSVTAFPSLELRKESRFPSAWLCHWLVTLVLCRYRDEIQMLIHHLGGSLFEPFISVLFLFLLTPIPRLWFSCSTHHFIVYLWGWWSNPGPCACCPDALTTEPQLQLLWPLAIRSQSALWAVYSFTADLMIQWNTALILEPSASEHLSALR